MFHSRVLVVFLFTIAIFLGGCSKKESTSPETDNHNTLKTRIIAKADGVPLTLNLIAVGKLRYTNKIAIIATNQPESERLDLTIDMHIKPGTYTFDFASGNDLTYWERKRSWTIDFNSNVDTLVITKSDEDEIEGTFSAVLVSMANFNSKKEITEGRFYLNLNDL